MKPVVVYIMSAHLDEAQMIGEKLVKEKLAACCNLVEGCRSLFIWQGNFCHEPEVLLIVKSRQGLLDSLIHRVKTLHSYELPEIIALPIIGGSEDYLNWMKNALA